MDNSQFPSQGQSVDGLYGVGQDTLVQRAVQRTFLWMTRAGHHRSSFGLYGR